MNNLTAVVTQLEQERSRLSSQLNGVEQAIQALRGLAGSSSGPRTGGGTFPVCRARVVAVGWTILAKVWLTKPSTQTYPDPKGINAFCSRLKAASYQR